MPSPSSHKGQNGKVMVIGGSELFHAASRWALDVVASMVDMVFYSSVPLNNALIREAKGEFWSGVIVPRGELENYLSEADVVLIGPGMTRQTLNDRSYDQLSDQDWNTNTYKITNYLLQKYSHKKWVIDAGALQMVDPHLLQKQMICTPHQGEFAQLAQKVGISLSSDLKKDTQQVSVALGSVTIVHKGEIDFVCQGEREQAVSGGNAGMTKGGTGDVLAGLIAGLYTMSDDPFSVGVVGSYVNKTAGDQLFSQVGPFYSTQQLVLQIPKVLKTLFYNS
ncbi:NAD(P)H-hydrate dehydratase [Candidatus Woesebacteria bacterium]|nr:NAD(P)H-hydrate dehydratase [Candidatus Woesebacteria bacterium]